ncbi:MAG: hypothetical protein GEV12_19310 [Micromonosporaceae bacterium]|nr:hypothetical protein [Micromonosporaceae bacterium]
MSTPTVLPAAALSQLAPATAPCTTTRFLRPALTRAALYLTPVPLAMAAAEPLGRVPWPVPVGAATAGWCAIQVLGYLGRAAAARAGAGPGGAAATAAARLVLVGGGALTAGWSALLAVAPAGLAGDDRPLAYAVSLPALLLFTAIAAALATGTAAALLRWSLPLLLAVAATSGWLPGQVLAVPAEPLLLAGIAVVAVRGFAPALPRRRPASADRGAGPAPVDAGGRSAARSGAGRWPARPGGGELRRAGARLALGLSQAATVVLVWRAGLAVAPPGTVPPALLPLLLTLPLIELCTGWHLARVAAGLARHNDRDQHLRYLRRLGRATLAGLLPPLIAGVALAGTAHRLPYGLSSHPDAPAAVLAMAGGVLLAGTIAVGWLLAGRDRPGLGAAVTGAVALGAPVLAIVSPPAPFSAAAGAGGAGALLPATVTALATGYAVGLVLAAYVLVDPRGPR